MGLPGFTIRSLRSLGSCAMHLAAYAPGNQVPVWLLLVLSARRFD
jgi:hypothetical protein